jgi:thiosulfate dehydrogenase [quinone] large subunit
MANERTYDHLATLLLRLFLGMMFLMAGLGKLPNLPGFYQYIEKEFGNTFLAGPLLTAFSHTLPFVEVTVGVLLVLGLMTRPTLVVTALTLLTLFFGKLVARDGQTSAFIALYFLIVMYALRHAESNKFSVDHLIHRFKKS